MESCKRNNTTCIKYIYIYNFVVEVYIYSHNRHVNRTVHTHTRRQQTRTTYPRLSWKCCRSRRNPSRSLVYVTGSLPRILAIVAQNPCLRHYTCHCKTLMFVNMTDSAMGRAGIVDAEIIRRPRRIVHLPHQGCSHLAVAGQAVDDSLRQQDVALTLTV